VREEHWCTDLQLPVQLTSTAADLHLDLTQFAEPTFGSGKERQPPSVSLSVRSPRSNSPTPRLSSSPITRHDKVAVGRSLFRLAEKHRTDEATSTKLKTPGRFGKCLSNETDCLISAPYGADFERIPSAKKENLHDPIR